MENDVAEQVCGTRIVLPEHGGIIDSFLFRREGVEVAADALQAVCDVDGSAALRAFETDVFQKVRHS